MTAGLPQNPDEVLWMKRTTGFSDALLRFDFSAVSATTGETTPSMPGVTTMWLGTIARGVWEPGRALGIFGGPSFAQSEVGLHLAQLAVAAATSILIGLFVFLAWRWAGAIAAIAAGALLATEPFVVFQGSMLHTDELEGLFAATGTIAFLLALGVPDGGASRPRAMASLAGALLAGAFLSKLSALLLVPGLAAIIGWACVRAVRQEKAPSRGSLAAMRPVARLVGIVLAAAIATTLLAWPALWADPVDQLSSLRRSGEIGGRGHLQFFLGEVTDTPGPLYYLVSIPFKMTPWFLLGMLAVIAAAVVRSTQTRLAAVALVALPALISLSFASKQIGRYALAVLPLMALAVGLGLDALWTLIRRRRLLRQRDPSVRRIAPLAAGSLLALMLAHSMWVAPWGTAYFNPILGGGSAAESKIIVAGTYGHDRAGEVIREREAPECAVTIGAFSAWAPESLYPCGSVERIRRVSDLGAGLDYVVVLSDYRQRFPDVASALRASGRTVAEAKLWGATNAEIIEVDPARASRSQPQVGDGGAAATGVDAPRAGGGDAESPGPAASGYQR